MTKVARLGGVLWLTVLGLAALPATGCGSDSGGKSTGGSGGKGVEDAGPGAGGVPTGSAACGQKICTPPEGSTACCLDAFSSTCGVQSAMGCGPAPKAPPKGCPMLPAVMGFMTTACCTSAGQCGVDETIIGMGCIEISVAAAQAMKMGIQVGQVPASASCTPGDGGS